jgi:hypothetical protein
MNNLYFLLSFLALIVFFRMTHDVSMLLREQRTTNELLRELLRK